MALTGSNRPKGGHVRWRAIVAVLAAGLSACTGQNAELVEADPRPTACVIATNPIWVVVNTHGTATGWLTGFARERNFMINNYKSLMDAADVDALPYVFSEVPTAIAMKELDAPQFERLKDQVSKRRAAVTNAFAVEYDPNFVSGPTVWKMGRMARDWFAKEMGKRPAIAWNIDALGVSPQLAESLDLLDVDLMVHERNAETLDPNYRLIAASGAQTLVASVKSYAQWRPAFKGTELPEAVANQLVEQLAVEAGRRPEQPFLWLVGASDYSSAPESPQLLRSLLDAVSRRTGRPACLGTSENFQSSLTSYAENAGTLTQISTPGIYSYNAFWANLPQIKQEFRSLESRITSADTALTIASLSDRTLVYPSQKLDDAWWLLLMNADRALLWGAGAAEPFTGAVDWNVRDRDGTAMQLLDDVEGTLKSAGPVYALDALNWTRRGSYRWDDPATAPAGATCERQLAGERLRCIGGVDSFSGDPITAREAKLPVQTPSTMLAETENLVVSLDGESGDILSISDRSTGKQIAGRSNRIVWSHHPVVEPPNPSPSDFMSPRKMRPEAGSTEGATADIRQYAGPLGTTIVATTTTSENARIVRTMHFPRLGDRIEFETTTAELPDGWIVSASFDLDRTIMRQLRGASLGYDRDLPRTPRAPSLVRATVDHAMVGFNDTAGPAIRWSSHLDADSRGLVIYDRGLLGREWGEDFADVMLTNTQPGYRTKENALLSGKLPLSFEYAISPALNETPAEFARQAMEYNTKPLPSRAVQRGFSTSETIVVEMLWRENRRAGLLAVNQADAPVTASVSIPWMHSSARLDGSAAQQDGPLKAEIRAGVPVYSVALAARDAFIITFETESAAPAVRQRLSWSDLVPPGKRSSLSLRDKSLVGHPPE